MDDLINVCKFFGPQPVLFLSNDNKARVPLGLAAASLQAPILMHIEYKVRLPDHNFVVGLHHTLIPSIYGVCKIKKNGELSCSGNTFIRIRSGKHDSSFAHTHTYNVKELFESSNLPERPILVLFTDGAQDEAPCYPKPLATAIHFFKHLKLDVFLHGVNAAGLSAFNPVERRMGPLSHDIVGVVIPHEKFGSHLDSQGNTIDVELEKKNFFYALQVLANIWSHTVITVCDQILANTCKA